MRAGGLSEEEHDEHGHEEHEGEEHGHGHHHEEGNPHVWLDPVLAQQQVANIRDALIEINPNNADSYSSNADAYIQQLQQLDNEFQQRLAPVKGCNFISFHDAKISNEYNKQPTNMELKPYSPNLELKTNASNRYPVT